MVFIFIFLIPTVSAEWSNEWSFNYSKAYDRQDTFSAYSTLEFGAKLNASGNDAPVITGEVPNNASIGITFSPVCSVTVNDSDGDTMNITFGTNESGSWVYSQTNDSESNGTYQWIFTNANEEGKKYWWRVFCDDGSLNISETYYFTTTQFISYSTLSFSSKLNMTGDGTPPSIIINFAGNLSDSGGPYWRPPTETVQLTGAFSDGYYVNKSYQKEDWIYINCTINDSESSVTNVWLNWKNESTWENWSYALTDRGEDYWDINTSGLISTKSGYNYSFDIVANSSGGSNASQWVKRCYDENDIRRTVQLNYSQTNISYTSLNMIFGEAYTIDDFNKKDIMEHDQGTNGAERDIGFFTTKTLSDDLNVILCLSSVGFWFNDNISVEPITVDNVYYHFWWSTQDETLADVSWNKSREDVDSYEGTQNFSTTKTKGYSNVTVDNGYGSYDNNYTLCAKKLTITDWSKRNFTDNSIYESIIQMDTNRLEDGYISVISNKSYKSFILINVPDNSTLNSENGGTGRDSDNDGLNDTTELYITHTHPFESDTDFDTQTDYDEYQNGSDPNNRSDTFNSIITEVSPIDCHLGETALGTNEIKNFIFYQNGTANLNVNISFNDTNYTYVNWATYNGNGHDQYTANFTIDSWASETNIEPGYPPTTVLNNSVLGNSNFGFGIRIWMPKSVTTPEFEDFTIVLNGEEI